ncbi:alpha/beta hydrolase-fold protein [Paenibacillus sp. PAMC 26794]|uniref:alpha/beta hydrolase n=1 Tax=Paenibacillus sp. PAMC 26794 TaxID=1257080 RepID=UPI0002E32DA3|nr:alpha/beta hydrolase-fold protein [Paenibacillus sp. PAMC 26794]
MATVQVNFFSKSMRREVSFNALLPVDSPMIPGQSESMNGQKPLKSLYLLNGYSGSQWDWITFSRIRELADRYRMAIFMPAGENHFYLDDEDKGDLHGQYVGKELVEFTRGLFPLSGRREDTYIGGLSMGGYGAIRNGLKYAEHFGGIIALSSALISYKIASAQPGYSDGIADYSYFRRVFGDLNQLEGSDKDPEALVLQLKEKRMPIPQIYMACGTGDFLLDVNQRFRDFLRTENVPVIYTEGPGLHNWDFWNDYIARALEWAGETVN